MDDKDRETALDTTWMLFGVFVVIALGVLAVLVFFDLVAGTGIIV